MPASRDPVLHLGPDRAAEITDVLCDAFAGYPVMQYVLGPIPGPYLDHVRQLIAFFVEARVHRREWLLGIADQDTLQGAALVSRPSGPASPPELAALRERLWTRLGDEALARYEALGVAFDRLQAPAPHLHLNMIGVRRAAAGSGYGRRLLDHVHALSLADPESAGVMLNTEVAGNVRLYERFGYAVVGQVEIEPGLTSWGMFRPDGP